MIITVEIEREGKRRLAYRHMIDRFEMENILPFKANALDPFEAYQAMQRAEQRRRVVDMISSQIAHAMTDALLGEER